MTLYELDPCERDDLVQSMLFPNLKVTLSCTANGCAAVRSAWVGPTGYNDPVWPPLVDTQISLIASAGLNLSQCANTCQPCTNNICGICE